MHEFLAAVLMVMVFAGLPLVMVYMRCLTAFFKELRQQEPDVWSAIGSPSLTNMIFLPFHNFKKFYAFLPVLKERRGRTDYRHAGRAYALLLAGLCYCAVIALCVAGIFVVILSEG